jgi:RNA polymerase sigma factor (sigma-70 family)
MKPLPQLTPAQQRLVEENIALVYFVARRYRNIPPQDLEDLHSRLRLRLCKSIAEWEPGRGYQLSSYVVKCLTGEAKNFFRDDIWIVKPPRSLRENSLSELLDTVKGSASTAELLGENPETIRTAALPLTLDGLNAWENGSVVPGALIDDADVEDAVTQEIGGRLRLQVLFAALRQEERLIWALVLRSIQPSPRLRREPRLKAPVPEVMERFGVTRAEAEEVLAELREKVEYYYHHLVAGYSCRPSEGNEALAGALRRHWMPPTGLLERDFLPDMVERDVTLVPQTEGLSGLALRRRLLEA